MDRTRRCGEERRCFLARRILTVGGWSIALAMTALLAVPVPVLAKEAGAQYEAELPSEQEGRRLDIDEAIQLALQSHPSIARAEENKESAQWQYSSARRAAGPRLRITASGMKLSGQTYKALQNKPAYSEATRFLREAFGLPNGETDPYNQEYNWTARLSYPLYTGGQLEGRRKQMRYQLNAADLALENVRQTVRYNVQAAYYRLLEYQAFQGIHEEAVELLQEHLNQANIQYKEGVAAMSDVLASEVQLAKEEMRLNEAQRDCLKAMSALNQLIGLPLTTKLELHGELSYQRHEKGLSDYAAYALQHRADGMASDYDVKQAEAAKSTAKAGFHPTVTASWTKDVSGENLFEKRHGEREYLGVSMEWNVFDNGVTSANVHAAQAQVQMAEAQRKTTRDTIELEVYQAYADMVCAERTTRTTETAMKKAEQEYRIAQVRYVEGVDTNLSVMDAQEKLTEARTNYYNSLYSCNLAKAALERAVGTPVAIDAVRYAEAEQAGKTPAKAIQYAEIGKAADEPMIYSKEAYHD